MNSKGIYFCLDKLMGDVRISRKGTRVVDRVQLLEVLYTRLEFGLAVVCNGEPVKILN